MTVRQQALQKLASLSATQTSPQLQQQDLHRLAQLCTHKSPRHNQSSSNGSSSVPIRRNLRAIPIRIAELEVLLALCRTASSLSDPASARQLLDQLSPYYEEAPFQQFAPSPYLRYISPSPWESLSDHLISAALSIGIAHPSLESAVKDRVYTFIDGCGRGARKVASFRLSGLEAEDPDLDQNLDEILGTCSLTLSIVGFLRAVSLHADFWSIEERLFVSQQLKGLLSDATLVNVEAAFSSIRSQPEAFDGDSEINDWIYWGDRYEAIGRPLGVMLLRHGFMEFLCSSASLLLFEPSLLRERSAVDILTARERVPLSNVQWEESQESEVILSLMRYAVDEMTLLEEGSDYLQLSSTGQQRLGSAVKGLAIMTYLACTFLNDTIADSATVMGWLESTISSPLEMADDSLAVIVLKSMSALARLSLDFARALSSSLPRFIVRGGSKAETAKVVADALSFVLSFLSHDTLSSTMYTLGNVLSDTQIQDQGKNLASAPNGTPNGSLNQRNISGSLNVHQNHPGSAISLAHSGEEEKALVYRNVIQTMTRLTAQSTDPKTVALTFSMLIQKIGKVSLPIDARIIVETAILGTHISETDFRSLLKLYNRLDLEATERSNHTVLQAVARARQTLATAIQPSSSLYQIYLSYLLATITAKGDVLEGSKAKQIDIEITGKEISPLIPPLAILLSKQPPYSPTDAAEDSAALFRDAWYNMSIHGFNRNSFVCRNHEKDLRQIALRSPPLVSEFIADHLDSDLELNTILRRGMSSQSLEVKRRDLCQVMPNHEAELRRLTYAHVSFVNAAHLLETLRAEAGDCSQIALYQMDRSSRDGDIGSSMKGLLDQVVDTYCERVVMASSPAVSAPRVAKQLAALFQLCCHRTERVQKAASYTADQILRVAPACLAQRESLFTLLELVSVVWNSCLAIDTDGYDWKSTYRSPTLGLALVLSDNYALRRQTCVRLHQQAKIWVTRTMDLAPMDIKGLLQTYLSDDNVDETYAHIALGRSLALELGAAIVQTDQRLVSVPPFDGPAPRLDVASEFMAQFSIRQEYRHDGALLGDFSISSFPSGADPGNSDTDSDDENVHELEPLLIKLATKATQRKYIGVVELREALKRAAAVLCRTSTPENCLIAHLIVQVPFLVFTKQAIKLGISLWLGVMNENPCMESRLLNEISSAWERSIALRQGVYDPRLRIVDPFHEKLEFAPMDRDAINRQHQLASDQIGPHLRLLHFFSSHYNAHHASNIHVRRLFGRIAMTTLQSNKYLSSHPLTREYRFSLLLFGLDILNHDRAFDAAGRWRLRDSILTTGLSWFAAKPCYSFGNSQLQIKAEYKILSNVSAMMRVTEVKHRDLVPYRALMPKQELLLLLVENEQTRLHNWLAPLGSGAAGHHLLHHGGRKVSDTILIQHLKLAWTQDPTITLQMTQRFQSDKLNHELRWLILNFPQQAIALPDALNYLLDDTGPPDLTFQLRYLQHWSSVDPMTAVRYLQPPYSSSPLILQYAMRALESHPVEITFFYVPQIVQSLRHDPLGYVERYIMETGTFSQLFAHQIIWNMKANAYGGDEGTVPDSLKPTLDKVESHLLDSFIEADRDFYDREFAFFDEVTGISGKLRPYVKESKAVKRDKITEELRKIKVAPGVYLPSNPEGVVVGIDRKSGKPLQSHAKTPFMATFLIQKNRSDHPVNIEHQAQQQAAEHNRDRQYTEIRQSAIFKVGDDCRQDVLALQMIAAFRGIFNSCGLDVFVYPYQVIATAPGCGVIEVLPNSISRDMLGREAVNGLQEYWISKYGSEETSIAYQRARTNFVKSMAAYSVISWILQFKDRHNGNIMFDDAGHILHIDFGFCFDIAPGGVKFERAPFKLTAEMVAVLGGDGSHTYRWFEELCVKAFLASRPYAGKLENIVRVMIDSGLPCFKPQTLENFRSRFVLEKDEAGAAKYMVGLVKKSHQARSTIEYDRFQRITNDIPY